MKLEDSTNAPNSNVVEHLLHAEILDSRQLFHQMEPLCEPPTCPSSLALLGSPLMVDQRPYLRSLPLPLSVVTNVEAWKNQAKDMAARRVWPRRLFGPSLR